VVCAMGQTSSLIAKGPVGYMIGLCVCGSLNISAWVSWLHLENFLVAFACLDIWIST
jgi:hypothetical protein